MTECTEVSYIVPSYIFFQFLINVGKVRIFIKKEGRMLKVQNEDLICFYRIGWLGKINELNFPTLMLFLIFQSI